MTFKKSDTQRFKDFIRDIESNGYRNVRVRKGRVFSGKTRIGSYKH